MKEIFWKIELTHKEMKEIVSLLKGKKLNAIQKQYLNATIECMKITISELEELL